MNYYSYLKKGILAAAVVFFMGFGIMNIFWMNYTGSNELLGLYDYKAATIGDGILLPILIGTIVSYLNKNNVLTTRQRTYSYVVGCIFLVIAIFIQIDWLNNENIELNWTIPKTCYFSCAGWYHAFFFITMFFLISMMFTRFWLTRMSLRELQKNIFDKLCSAVIWMAGSGFIFMHVLDDYGDTYNTIMLLFFTYIFLIILIELFCFFSVKKIMVEDITCIISGVSTSLGIGLIINGNFNWNILLFIENFFFSFAFVVRQRNKINNMIMYMLLIAVPSLTLSISSSGYRNNFFLLILNIIVPCLIAYGQTKDEDYDISQEICIQHMTCGCILIFLVNLTTVIFQLNNIEKYTSVINMFIDFVICRMGFSVIEKNFKYVVDVEIIYNQSSGEDKINKQEQLKITKFWSYFIVIMISSGILLFFILIMDSYIEVISLKKLIIFPIWNRIIVLLIFIMLFLLYILFSMKNIHSNETTIKNKVIFLSMLIITYFLVAVIVYSLRSPYVIKADILGLTSLFAFFMIIGSSVMIAENFYSNIVSIRGILGDFITKIATLIIGVGNFFVIMFSVLPSGDENGARTNSLIILLISLIGIIFSSLILPTLAGRIVQYEIDIFQVAATKPLGGIMQNGFLIVMLIFLGASCIL